MRKFFQDLSQKIQLRRMSGYSATELWPNPAAGRLPVLSDFAKQQLVLCKELAKPSQQPDAVDLEAFMSISDRFPIPFGTDAGRVKSQPVERRPHIRQQIASAYPIIHEQVLILYMNFLEHKLKFGNPKELSVYKNLTLPEFVQRLLEKRCVYFVGMLDDFMLLDGTHGYGGFEQTGTMNESAPLELKNVLSYDEIKLSALLYASTHSEFINDGSRTNAGRVEQDKSRIETDGIIMGLIGSRFGRSNVMECEDILITREQNTANRGYGYSGSAGNRVQDYRRLWRQFYEEPKDFRYNDVQADGKRFMRLKHDIKFDKQVMGKRFAISFDTLLLEAEARAASAGKPAYIHVVGIGLGVWKVSDQQEEIFLATFEQRLRALSAKLTHIGVVHFSWFHLDKWGGLFDGACIEEPAHPQGGIQVRISVRNPADKLKESMLPIVTYAWDGNALPGNEFWSKSLDSSSDPAAACSTLIAELLNAHINKDYMSGNNLHIASMQHGVLHISDYAEKLLNDVAARDL
ncbi:PREDICTED: uncharacterized protein LOC108618941 [Drosophila arizonae]|uniref:Uncharacterized protein LOC108618941 n=1 Tax=Drosophila arizonae TaxID=7263 RepID=A0ABM1PTX6_DROAR|nr:PREDICTED: uncharacterized protein LOC108618941 [Drosophila arizonae]